MALTAPAITAAIHAAGPDILGPTFPLLTEALGAAVYAWTIVPANFALAGVTTGLIGSGSVSGKLVVPPNLVPMATAFSGNGVVGPTSSRIGSAVAIGIANAFTTFAQYSGVSVGVGVGTDLSVVSVANIPTLIATISSTFIGAGIVGPTSPLMATAFGEGIALTLAAATTVPGTGLVSGGGAGSPGAGVSTSSVF